tara:strand:+ start:2416 stop:2709 length:294 start_codon:yes stop_codon:yes gene_type:complete
MSLRGTNQYKDRSVIFITGRNQPPLSDVERQARAVFGNSGNPLAYDDLENLPSDQVEYWLSQPCKPVNHFGLSFGLDNRDPFLKLFIYPNLFANIVA